MSRTLPHGPATTPYSLCCISFDRLMADLIAFGTSSPLRAEKPNPNFSMKIRCFLASLFLVFVSPAHATVSLSDTLITDTQLEFIVGWDSTFSAPSGLVVDIFAPPWFSFSANEPDDTGVLVHSGGFDAQITFGPTRRFADAFVGFSVNPGYSLVIEPVPGEDFAAQFRAAALPESSTRW